MKDKPARDFSSVREILLNSFLVCALTTAVGAGAAQYRVGHHRKRTLNIPSMLMTVGCGAAMHGVLCAALSWSTIAYLFIAGPVQYIARFLGRGVKKWYTRVVFLRPKGGVTEKLEFPEKAMLNFRPGDHVLKLSAFKFPVNCSFDEDRDVYCPNCGHSSPAGRRQCVRCRMALGREK